MFAETLHFDREIIILSVIYGMLSLLDASLTLWGLNLGVVDEANPLMALFIGLSPILFVGIKLMGPIITGLFCWKIRIKRPGLSALILWLAIAAYSLVTLVHGYWVMTYL